MKKLILSGGILTLLVTAFALMSLTTPAPKVHVPVKKPLTINFLLQNTTSNINVSWTFRLNGVMQTASGVLNAGHSQNVPLPAGSYEVILNNANGMAPFNMLFNTGEYADAPGHTFFGINVNTGASTSLHFY